MPRHGTNPRLHEDIDREQAGNEPDAPAIVLDTDDQPPEPPHVAEAKEIEFQPLQTAPMRKAGSGILSLILIAILGIAIGFAVVMLI
jgi:hypothetical protein